MGKTHGNSKLRAKMDLKQLKRELQPKQILAEGSTSPEHMGKQLYDKRGIPQ